MYQSIVVSVLVFNGILYLSFSMVFWITWNLSWLCKLARTIQLSSSLCQLVHNHRDVQRGFRDLKSPNDNEGRVFSLVNYAALNNLFNWIRCFFPQKFFQMMVWEVLQKKFCRCSFLKILFFIIEISSLKIHKFVAAQKGSPSNILLWHSFWKQKVKKNFSIITK